MQKALVAVSGGSDSLALLHILLSKKEYELIVAHVNYNYRESSKRDEEIVTLFCTKNNIILEKLVLDSKQEKEGNFEDWARVKRYKFFKEIYDKYNCVCLFVGHQKEDVIETYYMQEKRNAIVEYYGMAKETFIQGMKVVRPLLAYTKKELEEYCLTHNIVYGVDETNFDLSYSRNRIRHEVISKMSEEEKNNIIEKLEILNTKKQEHVKKVKGLEKDCLIKKNILDLNKFFYVNEEYKKEIIYYFLIENIYKKISIKSSRIDDILKKIHSNKPNIVLACYDDITLYKEYNLLVIEKNKKEYSYVIENNKASNVGDRFVISNEGKKLEKVVIEESRFPLYVKNYDGNNKKINRIFIDKKIPLRKRKSWPVIVDKFGVLLLVIGIKKFYNELYDFDGGIVEFYIHDSEQNKGE